MNISLLTQISAEGVVPLFRFWAEECLRGVSAKKNPSGWDADTVREQYLRSRVQNQSFTKRIFDLSQEKWEINQALNDTLFTLQGCRFVTLFRDFAHYLTVLCEFSESRVTVLFVPTFHFVEFDRLTWMNMLMAAVVDGDGDSFKQLFMDSSEDKDVTEIWIY